MRTIALVAAKNAATSIAATVAALRSLKGVDEVWVVDDGSTDATADAAVEAGAWVVRLERNRGKGDALAAGIDATPHAQRYLLADADLGATAAGLQPLLDARGDLVVGVLPSAGRRGGFGSVVRLGRAGIRRATGRTVDAPLSGQRVVDGALLRSMVLAPRFGVEVGMTIDALRRNATAADVPVEVEHHHRGRSLGGFVHRGRQALDVAAALVPRLLTRTQQVVAISVVAVLTFGALSAISVLRRAPAGVPLPVVSQVVLFAYEDLTVDALDGIGARGMLTVRTSDRRSLSRRAGSEGPSRADAFASLGASARVRWAGTMERSRAQARDDHADSLPGALGDTLRAARKRVGLLGRVDAAPALESRRRGVAVYGSISTLLANSDVALVAPAGGSDAALRETRAALPDRALLIVFAPTPPGDEWELTPIAISGPGIDGGAIASATTRRAALGGLVDLAPTVLRALAIAPPAAMTGAALRVSDAEPDFAAFERAEVDGAVRGRFFLPAAVGYTVVGIVAYLGFIAARLAGHRRGLRLGVCCLAAFPLATLVQGGVQHWLRFGGESPALLVALSVALGALAARVRGVGAVYVVAAATLGVLLLDVAATGPLQSASILGYSLQTTGRYYGLPNASFAVYVASLLLVGAAVAGWKPSAIRALGASAVVAVGTAFVAAPWLGNDVGGTLTLVPVGLAAGWAWFGRSLTPRVLGAGALVAVAVLGAYAMVESLGDGTTHLARALGEGTSLRNTLTRRVNANFGLLVDQWWGFLSLALAAGSMIVLRVRPRLSAYLPLGSGLRVAAYATLAASILGFLVNDSGPVVNVLCLVVLAPAVALSALAGSTRPTVVDPRS